MRREGDIHDHALVEQAIMVRKRVLDAALDRLASADRRLDEEHKAHLRSATSEARTADLMAQGKRMLMAGCAVAMVILSIALAIRIAQGGSAEPVAERVSGAPLPQVAPSSTREDIVVRNYVLFTETTRTVGSVEYLIRAGHEFRDENASSFEAAWCYTDGFQDGLSLRVDLGRLEPGSEPILAPMSGNHAALDVDAQEANELFLACPWMSPEPSVRETSAGSFQFFGEVTEESVDRLVAALESGVQEVVLESMGGDLAAALRGHDAIRAASARTIATGQCASACVVLFAGGRERSLEADGAIGVHQWRSFEGVIDEADAQLLTAELLARLHEAGISPDLYIAASRVPADGLHVLTPQELRDWRVVTQVDA